MRNGKRWVACGLWLVEDEEACGLRPVACGREYGESVEVRADVMVSLNGRPEQRLIDPDVDLAREKRGPWPKPWILPLTTPLQ